MPLTPPVALRMVYCLATYVPGSERCLHGRAAERRGPGDIGAVGIRGRNFHHVARRRREDEIALHGKRADRIARRQRAAVDRGVADRAVAAERAAGVDGGKRRGCDRAVDAERAGVDVGGAGVGVDAGKRKHAAADLLHTARVRDDAAVRDCIGAVKIERAAVKDVADNSAGGAAIAHIHGADEACCARAARYCTEIVDRHGSGVGASQNTDAAGLDDRSGRDIDGYVAGSGGRSKADRRHI